MGITFAMAHYYLVRNKLDMVEEMLREAIIFTFSNSNLAQDRQRVGKLKKGPSILGIKMKNHNKVQGVF